MKHLKTFILAVAAGLFISIGGCVYLLSPDKIVGAIMFAVGLYSIVCFSLNLFTGKVGYWMDNGFNFGIDLIFILLGNFVGTFFPGVATSLTRWPTVSKNAAELVAVKLADTPISIFILAIFCGILMFTAVELYKKTKNPLGVFICVPVFILCGFEHCIANMFYISAASMWSFRAFIYMLIMIFGNAVGGLLLPTLLKLSERIK